MMEARIMEGTSMPRASGGRRAKVLVIDDASTIREILEAVLTEAGYDVYPAADEAEAFEMLARVKPNAIVLDMRMPDTAGETIARFLKGPLGLPTPIVVYSGHPNLESLARAAGAVAFVSKARPVEDLVAAIGGALAAAGGGKAHG
jgi:CheY-like chemotaxis protein